MLGLTDTQGQIIEQFVEHFTNKKGQILNGLTGAELEKYGIVARTFRNHKNYFLDNYLIRLNQIEYHGHQNWYRYQITRLGIIAYLKWIEGKHVKKIILMNRKFFPLIGKHWEQLFTRYGKILSQVMEQTIERIEIKSTMVGSIKEKPMHSSALTESITLQTGMIDLKLYRLYKPTIIQVKEKHSLMKIETLDNKSNLEIDNGISERFTFLFYYNLIGSGKDAGMIIEICTKLLFPSKLKDLDVLVQNPQQYKKNMSKLMLKLEKNSQYVISLIKKDKKLYQLFYFTISEVNKQMKNSKILSYLKKEFS